VAFGKTAENCTQFLHKGSLVCVEGSLQTRTWEKPPGEKHYMTEIIAFRISFLESKGGTSGRNNDENDEDGEAESF
jgi:single-strand DNA-binding protein